MPTYPANYPIVNQLPADAHLPEHPDIQTLTRSLNTHGAYVHKIRYILQNATAKLDKILARQIPTPASLVGVGISRTYNQSNVFHDDMTTGLVFATDTPSAMGHKHDFGSNILIGENFAPNLQQTNGDTSANDQAEALAIYSRQLITKYRETAGRQVACHALQVKDKLREIEIRSNLGQSRSPDAQTVLQKRDVGSKVLLRGLMLAHGRDPLHRWTADQLIAFIHECSESDALLRAQLAHVIPKIQSFDSEDSLNSWLSKPENTNPNRYATEFKQHGTAKAPSEFLTLPTIQHVVGVSVELAYPGSIDNAMYLNSLLPASKPAFLLCISDKQQSSLIAMDWTRDLLPLSKHGMQQFLVTGHILDAAGQQKKPDLFSAMHQTALHGQIRFLQDRVGENFWRFYPPGLVAPNPILDEHHINIEQLKRKFKNVNPFAQLMSGCMPAAFQKRSDEEVTTALERVLKNGESESVVRFFFHFCPPEKRPDADTIQRLETRYPHHPAMPVLNRLVGMTPEQQEVDRINLLTQEFHRLGSPQSMSFDLRSGWHETGKARFIPELMGFRVTEGVFHADYVSDTQFEGLARYSPEQKDMSLCVGVKKHGGDIVEAGFFQPDENLIPRLTSGCAVSMSTDLHSLLERPACELSWCFQEKGEQAAKAIQKLSFALFDTLPAGQDSQARLDKLVLELPNRNGRGQTHTLNFTDFLDQVQIVDRLEQLKRSTWHSDMGKSQLAALIDTLDAYALASVAHARQAHIKRPDEAIKETLQSAKQFQHAWNESIHHAIQSNGGMTINANSIFQRSVAQHVNEQFPTLDVRYEYPLSAATVTPAR